jgi:hypothetical protein
MKSARTEIKILSIRIHKPISSLLRISTEKLQGPMPGKNSTMAKTLSPAQKAAQTRKRRTTARKAAVTRNRRAGARKAAVTRNQRQVMQWGDICKVYFMLTGKVGFRSIRADLKRQVDAGLIEDNTKNIEGQWLFTKTGWEKFQRDGQGK